MKTHVFTIDLKPQPGLIQKYRDYHAAVWDDVKEGMRSIGIRKNAIYLYGTRLINIMETVDDFDPKTAFQNYYAGRPKAEEWDRLMATFQQPLPEAGKGEWWSQMEKVFEYVCPEEETCNR
jgi:L-rhamnose mutarotase